ncbi:hypothetical protein N9359_04465 [Luminiphilus sp.]|nr:hypothetical protein [Luminiphilus sp.]
MTKRKSLKPVDQLRDKAPVTTAAVRKAVQASNREEVLAHPMAADHTDWMFKVARGEIEASPAVQSLCLKELHSSLYGLEEERTKRASDSVTINITGIGADNAKDISRALIEGESREVVNDD